MNKTQQTQAPKKNASKQSASQPQAKPSTQGKQAAPKTATPKQTDELDLKRAEGEGMTPPDPQKDKKTATPDGLEGEGSYTASRHYREGVEKSIQAGNTDELARKAADAVDGPQGKELREAEEAGKHHKTAKNNKNPAVN